MKQVVLNVPEKIEEFNTDKQKFIESLSTINKEIRKIESYLNANFPGALSPHYEDIGAITLSVGELTVLLFLNKKNKWRIGINRLDKNDNWVALADAPAMTRFEYQKFINAFWKGRDKDPVNFYVQWDHLLFPEHAA